MAQAELYKIYSPFVSGFSTESNPLQFPEDTAEFLQDVQLTPQALLKRLGANKEAGFSSSTATFDNALVGSDIAITAHTWRNAGQSEDINFHVVQIGSTLYFHEAKVSAPSTMEKSFSVDLTSFTAPAFTSPADVRVQTTSGKGALFVVSKKIEPFYVTYDEATDTIATQQITIEVRDFEGLDDGLDVDEQPATLSDEHKYNLYNQGWRHPDTPTTAEQTYVDNYFADTGSGVYPSNVQQWFLGKDTASLTNLKSNEIRVFPWGNTPAPKGHYILNAFNKDRATVAGFGSFTAETTDNRPLDVNFYGGRIWYTTKDGVYFSQLVLDDFSNVGRCYQEQDPTAEDLNQLVDTDGGFLSIPEAGIVYALKAIGNSNIVFADNGVWQISSIDSGFKATDISVDKISDVGVTGTFAVVKAENTVVWWADQGIYTLSVNEVSGKFTAQSLSLTTIQTLYNAIPDNSKMDAFGFYDVGNKTIRWFYKSGDDGFNKFSYQDVLALDLRLTAFYTWKIQKSLTSTPYIFAAVDNLLTVTDNRKGFTRMKTLVVEPNSTSSTYTFGEFQGDDFTDWGINGYKGIIRSGYDILGEGQKVKRAVEATIFFERTETDITADEEGGLTINTPSSLKVRVGYDWADSDISGRLSDQQEGYALRRDYYPSTEDETYDDGFPVVFSRIALRGQGLATQFLFEGEASKDFILLGYAVQYYSNTRR